MQFYDRLAEIVTRDAGGTQHSFEARWIDESKREETTK